MGEIGKINADLPYNDFVIKCGDDIINLYFDQFIIFTRSVIPPSDIYILDPTAISLI